MRPLLMERFMMSRGRARVQGASSRRFCERCDLGRRLRVVAQDIVDWPSPECERVPVCGGGRDQ